jgi:hypothetical protein
MAVCPANTGDSRFLVAKLFNVKAEDWLLILPDQPPSPGPVPAASAT